MRGSALFLATVAAFASFIVLPAAARAPRVSDVAGEVICPCPDDCMRVLGDCVCGYAEGYRSEIDSLLSAGLDAGQAKESFLTTHGERFRASPKFSGAGLLLWLIPPIVVIVSLAGLIGVVRRWSSAPAPVAGGPSVSDDEAARFEADLEEFDV